MRFFISTFSGILFLGVVFSGAGSLYWPSNEVRSTSTLAAPYIAPPYTCVTNYYVAKSGNDANDGTSVASAWLTISKALNVLARVGGTHGGVCVNVEPGTYVGSNYAKDLSGSADTSTGYLVFRSTTLHGATVQVPLDQASGFNNSFRFDDAHFVVIDGFNLVGSIAPGSIENGIVFCSLSSLCDHVKVLNNVIHDHGGAGVGANRTDYLFIEGNVIYNNANTSPYQTSGISSYQAVASDNASGFHNVIANNIVFNNGERDTGLETHTDGNGIIIDDFRNSQNGSSYGVYAPATLVENNLSFGNGGRGIHVFFSDNVTVRNNTTFDNCKDPIGLGTWRGEISVVNGGNNTFVNNVAVANALAVNTFNATNVALLDNSTDHSNLGNVWVNNLSFNGTEGEASIMLANSPSKITSAGGNILGSNPHFDSPRAANFALTARSPAVGAGTTAYGVSSADLSGSARISGSAVDMGAYGYPIAGANSIKGQMR
jgi:parallel beta-helix repeat protein